MEEKKEVFSLLQRVISKRSFCPDYIEFNNQFFSADRVVFKDCGLKITSLESNFTFMVWIKSNASSRSKLFNIFDLHVSKEKPLNLLKIFLLNRKLYIKYLDQIEKEITSVIFDEDWTHLSIIFIQNKEKTEISLFFNGLLSSSLVFPFKKQEITSIMNESLELSFGFDPPLRKKKQNSSKRLTYYQEDPWEYFRIGPLLLIDWGLAPEDVSLIYSIIDPFKGTLDLLKNEHELNFQRISLENLKGLGFGVKGKKGIKPLGSKLFVKANLAVLFNGIVIEIDGGSLVLVKEKRKKGIILVNKAEKQDWGQGIVLNDSNWSSFIAEKSFILRNENLKLDCLVEIVLGLLNKCQDNHSFLYVFLILKPLFENYQDELPKEAIIVLFEILKVKKSFFKAIPIEELFGLFSRRIGRGKEGEKQFLISGIENFRAIFMNDEFYRDFFRDSIEVLEFLEVLCRNFLNYKCNVFSE